MKLLLRRTLVLMLVEWAMVNATCFNYSVFTIQNWRIKFRTHKWVTQRKPN